MSKHKSPKNKSQRMRCPYCGSPVVLRSADGIYRENSQGAMLYVCSRYPECDAYVKVHPGTNIPMGSLANHELRTLRRTAHYYFDQLYKIGRMTRQESYRWLADKICVPLKGQSAVGSYTREDLFQVGCIGLCGAIATDKGWTYQSWTTVSTGQR